jgi:hypothetical protein
MAVEDDVFDGHIVLEEAVADGLAVEAGLLKAKFVHYPGSQQLIVWLPSSGYDGYGDLRVSGPSGEVERGPVRSRLNGSVQILFATLNWPPGAYRIEIDVEGGGCHVLAMRKLETGVEPPAPPPPVPEPELFQRDELGQIIYRDGFGKVIERGDVAIRAAAAASLAARFSRQLKFEGNFRSGKIIYVEGERRIEFWHEMAGGGYHMTVDIPTAEHWERATGAPLSERDDIVRFVAEETQRQQAPSWSFEITASDIRYF